MNNIIIFEKICQSNHIFNSCLRSYLTLYEFHYKKSVFFKANHICQESDKYDEIDCCTKYIIYDKSDKHVMTLDVVYEVANDSTIRIVCRSNELDASDDVLIIYNFFIKRKFRQII